MSARPRLIFVNRYFHPDLSATSQLLTDLVRALEDSEFDLHVVSSRQRYEQGPDERLNDARSALPARSRVGSALVHRTWSTRFGRASLPGRLLDYLTFYVSSLYAILRLARRGDLIVALTDPPMLSVGLAALARLRAARLVNWLQDLFPEVAIALGTVWLPAWLARALLSLRNASLRSAVMNVVLGERMRTRVSALGIAAERIAVIENWADGQAIRPRAAHESALRRSLPPAAQFVVQYSGNLGRAHEYQTILGAAQLLALEPGWLFLMVGGGVNMARLRSEAGRLALGNLLFLPYRPREDLADSLAAGDVHLSCLLPAMEGLIVPSKFYGILAAGRPVIVIGDTQGEQARIVREQDCGAAVECGDCVALAQLLRDLRADTARCRGQGGRARALFDRCYAPTQAMARWRDVLWSHAR